MTSNQRLTGNFRIEWKPDTMTNIIFRPDFTYQRNRGRGNSLSASYSANPNDTILNRLADIMVNSNGNRNMSYNTNTTLKGELQANRKLNSRGRNLTLRVVGNYGDGRSEQLSAANITCNTQGTDQQNNRYYETPAKNFGLLGQQTNISRTIDALMRTDSRHNAIYQYGMLRVVYRFNILGGKNNLKEKKEHEEWDGDWGDWGGGW